MNKKYDCVVCGTCTVDILVKPVDLQQPLGGDRLYLVEPIHATTGGIVANAGMALAKLGNRTAAMTGTGRDAWSEIILQRFTAADVDPVGVIQIEGQSTSTTIVLIDAGGQRSFAHTPGAPAQLDAEFFESQFELLENSRAVLLGYYSLLPALEPDLADLFRRLRMAGCLTALDSAGSGGTMEPLAKILPHLDVYFPSFEEARNQTGRNDPQEMIEVFRRSGSTGILGVKLGAQGVALSESPGKFQLVGAIEPPGPIADTTGAGDAFFAGLMTGILRGMSTLASTQLGTAVAAISITGLGASTALPTLDQATSLCSSEFPN